MYGDVMKELRARGLVRSSNGPGADYAEGLIAKAFKLELNVASTAGHDGVDSRGLRFEVKCRRLTGHNKSRQLSAIRGLEKKHFDYLAGVLFGHDFSVLRAALIPYRVVKEQANFVERTNSWRFLLRDSVWKLAGVKDITEKVRKAQSWGEIVE
jgi:hypothetical protein